MDANYVKEEQREVRRLRHYRPSDMFSEDEVNMMIDVCDNLRDKWLVASIYDDALRPHEILRGHIADATFHEKYLQFTVPDDTKTGTRTLPAIASFPYWRDWLNCHPLKHDPEAFLCVRNRGVFRRDFVRTNGRGGSLEQINYHFKPNMDYVTLWFMFKKLKDRLNHKLKKRYWYPYMLRHSRLTVLANVLTDQQLKRFAGWSPDSNMPSVYIHLSGKELDEPLLIEHGIVKAENKKRPQFTVRACPRCEHINQITNKFCDKCSFPLTVQGFEEVRQKEQQRETDFEDMKKKMLVYDDILGKFMGGKLKVSVENGVTRLEEK